MEACPASTTRDVWRPHAKELSIAFLARYSAGGLQTARSASNSALHMQAGGAPGSTFVRTEGSCCAASCHKA